MDVFSISNQYVWEFFFKRSKSILKILNKIPYRDITKIYKIPKKIFVLIFAKRSKALDIFFEKIWVKINIIPTKSANISNEKILNVVVNTKNQNEKPKVTANALKLLDETCILYRIN